MPLITGSRGHVPVNMAISVGLEREAAGWEALEVEEEAEEREQR